MAVSTIKKEPNPIIKDNVQYGDVLIGNAGYTSLGLIAEGKELLSATIGSWVSNSGVFSIAIGSGNVLWLIGTPNTTVRGLNAIITYR